MKRRRSVEKILIVEDNKDMQTILGNLLEDAGYKTVRFEDGKKALEAGKKISPSLILLDIHLPGMSGMRVLEQIKENDEHVPVIMLTAFGDVKGAVQAMKLGAYDYITKPFDIEELMLTIKRALHTGYLSREVESLRKKLGEKTPETIVGNSPELKRILKQVDLVAGTDMTVVIQGRSGTGKELVARMIHNKSKRRRKPFLAIDCGAIPETLVESQLFGHEKGAFTGAVGAKEGIFEQANGGTLFLDEISNLPASAQMKFLRVLQERKLQHIGGKGCVDVNVRIIVATNTPLIEAVRSKDFRNDLFHRLNEFNIDLPGLRERTGDIPVLAKHFLKQVNNEFSKDIKGFSREAMDQMKEYSWPGNVREMINVIRRAGLLCQGEEIRPEHLSLTAQRLDQELASPGEISLAALEENSYEGAIQSIEKELIRKALKKTAGNKTRAARILKMNRKTFYRKLKKLDLL